MPPARLLPLLLAIAACAAPETGTGPQAPVASVTVTLSQSAAVTGTPVTATVVLRDAEGNRVDRDVAWRSSDPLVATVSSAGVVTPVGVGAAAITAISEGKSGAATLTVTSAVAQVTIAGFSRLKVGDRYQFVATVRDGSGNIIERPVTWSVVSGLNADITSTGVLTPLLVGSVVVRATIDNIAAERVAATYDWEGGAEGQLSYMRLESDAPVSDPLGRPVFPRLGVTCTGPNAELAVHTGMTIVPNGSVSITVDGGMPMTQVWHAQSDANWQGFNGLLHPGGADARQLLSSIAAAKHVVVAFADVQGVVRTAQFRVTGLEVALTASMLGISNSPLCF